MNFDKAFDHSEALFQAAIEEFSAAGYEQASINTILTRAGMSKGQFYYHFENKQGLYFALIEVLISRKQEFLSGVMQPADFEQDIFTILRTQIQHGLAFAHAHPEVNAFSDSFLREKGNTIYEATMERFNFNNNAPLGDLITQAHQRGEFKQDLPLDFVQRTITYMFSHAADFTDLSSEDNAQENLDRLVDFLRAGLARNVDTSQE
ncbi:MAG: TetR/AcrR family transcriptional regulator [Chloroflexi bacterium]|nr:MAG: TetR/AcrR family transcriptional regulator [Chloroflexota bacterium]MBL1195948.1 TetR/AcrR family transcriptional regulator [Chloroflexota bacterium]NOH13242.1 TetR/AcrR family transcriptional regulator [Chloroflexota bacterium]